jgi:hypothetical protein
LRLDNRVRRLETRAPRRCSDAQLRDEVREAIEVAGSDLTPDQVIALGDVIAVAEFGDPAGVAVDDDELAATVVALVERSRVAALIDLLRAYASGRAESLARALERALADRLVGE